MYHWTAVLAILLLAAFEAQALWQWNLDDALRYMDYSESASCQIADISAWSCVYCVNSTVGFQPLAIGFNSTTDNLVFYGVHHDSQEIVVSFRGTKPTSLLNWLTDLNVFSSDMSFPPYPTAMVHKGFLEVYESHQSFLYPAVPNLMAQYPDYQVVLTGKSLGGPLATMMAMDLYVNYGFSSNVKMVTFGSPRVGDQGFRDLFSSSGIQHWRVTHGQDPVPHLPPKSWGFIHVPNEIWQVETNGVSTYTQCSDVDAEDPNCSDSNLFDLTISDHQTYLLIKSGQCTGP